MQFYIIYSFDVKREMSVNAFKPPKVRSLWDMTEDDECYEFDYLDDGDGSYLNGKHRKYVTKEPLTKDQFEEFLMETGLMMEDVETMGSLTDMGHLMAFSFNGEHSDYPELIWQNAYVTPFAEHVDPEKEFTKPMTEASYQRLKRAMLTKYEYGV